MNILRTSNLSCVQRLLIHCPFGVPIEHKISIYMSFMTKYSVGFVLLSLGRNEHVLFLLFTLCIPIQLKILKIILE